jgi:cell division septation protein DedD
MNIPELQKKVADVLGVSSSQKELAFEIFIDTVASILTEGITLKVPGIGFFQIKNASIKAGDNKSLIFSSLPEDFTREDKNLFLTIDVLQKSNTTSEYDSNVFSIGVGKPLLPLTMDEMPDSETSYAMLRKSIEERVKELISESDQIPNFNVWDDYYKENPETGKQFPDPGSNHNVKNTSFDFILPGLGRSDASKSSDNNNLLNTLIVDIPDFNQQNENQEEKHLNNTEQSVSKEDGDEFVVIKGVNPLSNGITIDDLLDDSEADNNVGNAKSIEFEIPDSDLSKILIEEPLVIQPKRENTNDKPVEETISINDFLDNPISPEKTIDLNEYLNSEQIQDQEKQISLKDLGLDRESMGNAKLYPESESEFLSNDRISGQLRDESGEQSNIIDNSYYETDKVNEDEILKQEDKLKTNIEDDFGRLEKSIYGFTIEINEKDEPIDDPFEELIASSKKANETATKEPDNFGLVENDKNDVKTESTDETGFKDERWVDLIQSEPIVDKNENINTKFEKDLKSKDSVVGEQKTPDDLSEESNSKSADEFEIINWPDPMEVKNNERIEWNWGDELKEEFGLGSSETEDIAFEEVDDLIDNNESLVSEDGIEEQENLKKDLFSRLERTLEHEVTSLHEIDDEIRTPIIQKLQIPNEIPEGNLTYQGKKSSGKTTGDILIKNDEKVFLEFHGPPPKYQFVEDKSPLNEKRMAITLSPEFFEELRQESSQRITREKNKDTATLPIPIVKELIDNELDSNSDSLPKRDNSIRTFSIIISILIVVGFVVVFFFLRNNSNPNQTVYNIPTQQESAQKTAPVESQTSNSSQEIQTQAPSKINSNLNMDESSDFPASATPPVPIKDQATDMPSSSIPKKESRAAIHKSNSEIKPEQKKVEKSIENNGLYRTLTTDTKINNTIYYDGKSYNFQVSSWRDKLKSETEVKRLRALGMIAFIVEAYLPQKGGKWFRVRVGSFNSEKQAEEYKTKNNL